MTKIAFVADVHVGNHGVMGGPIKCGLNERCWEVIETIKQALFKAFIEGCTHFIVAGDLFDTTKPLPQMIAHVYSALVASDLQPVLLVGNHEHVSTDRLDHALAPFYSSTILVERPRVLQIGDIDLMCIPCIPTQARDWFADEVAKLAQGLQDTKSRSRLLCFHLGVEDENTPFYLSGAKDSIDADTVLEVCEKYDIQAVFAGNWHDRRTWEDTVFQVGALCPTGFDNPGREGYGGLAIYDSSSGDVKEFEIPGPRFLTAVKGTPLDDIKSKNGNKSYVRFKCEPSEAAEVKAHAVALEEAGTIHKAMVMLDRAQQEAAAKKAAEEVRKTDTLADALTAYVSELEVPEGVDSREVIRRSERYLKG